MRIHDKPAKALFFVMIAAIGLSHCKQNAPAALQGEVLDEAGLMAIVHQPEISICVVIDRSLDPLPQKKTLSGASLAHPAKTSTPAPMLPITEAQRTTAEENLRIGFELWMKSLKVFTGKDVISKLKFLHESDGCKVASSKEIFASAPLNAGLAHLSVVLSPKKSLEDQAIAYVIPHKPGQIWVVLGNKSNDRVITHEIGHTLGLADTYDLNEKSVTGVMNYNITHWNGQLYPDDHATLKYAYCKVHYKSNLAICSKLNPKNVSGAYPNFGPDGKLLYSMASFDGTFEDSQYILRDTTITRMNCVRVKTVVPGGNLEKSGISVGDCITYLAHFSVRTIDELEFKLAHQDIPQTTTIELILSGQTTYKQAVDSHIYRSIKLSLNSTPIEHPPAAAAINRSETPFVVSDVIKTTTETALQTGTTISATIPRNTHLTVLNLQKSGKTSWLWVTYFGKAGWVDAANVVLANKPN